MREGLHGSNDCTSLHLMETWADTEGSNLSNSINKSFNSSSPLALDGPVQASLLTLRAIFALRDLELLLLHANKTASVANTLFFLFRLQFWILLRSDGKSISNTEADFLEMNKTESVWRLDSCSSPLLYQSFIPLADWALIIHRINELLTFVSQFCARSFLPHVQPHSVHVMNVAPWGRRLVTSSLTTLTGRTSGRNILTTHPPRLATLSFSLACGTEARSNRCLKHLAAVYLKRVMFALV